MTFFDIRHGKIGKWMQTDQDEEEIKKNTPSIKSEEKQNNIVEIMYLTDDLDEY